MGTGRTGHADGPNVVVILTDDQGWGDLSVHGNRNLQTPNIDSLARDGALFERFYVCPVCSPTRAEFLTGRYHPRGNVWNVSTGGERLDLDERTIAETFKAAGYATGAFGKWHNGTQYPYHPNGRGFDEFYGFCSGHWGDYFDAPLEQNGRSVTGRGFVIDDFTDQALSFIEANQKGRFFCYLPYNTPHTPMQVPDRFYDRFRDAPLPMRYHGPQPEDPQMTRAALAMCENIDWNVGRVLTKLKELNLENDTLVLYFSDNGPNSFRWNDGMKGRKGSTDEGGVRAPLLMRWPGQIPAGTRIPQIAAAIDLLPTLAELCGIPRIGDKPLDGRSLAPLLRDTRPEWPDRLIFSHWANQVSARSQQYRYDAQGRLYDMVSDPGQQQDVSQSVPEVTARFKAAVAGWRRDVLSEMQRTPVPFTVGYRAFPITQLPARDGIGSGAIQRSAKAPNCSYFTNWTRAEDVITWQVDVATAGRYQIDVLYACSEANVGSTIRLQLGMRSLTARLDKAHDPPLHGAEHDRYPRNGESLVKDFRPWRMGEMEVDRGPGTLTLSAVSVAGTEVMEVRGLILTLVESQE